MTKGIAMPRDRGTGSVYRAADGRWRATIEAGWTAGGTRRRITITADTKTAAQTKLKAKLREIAERGIPAPGTSSITVKRWADDWIARRSGERRPKTQSTDESAVRRWIIPTIGHKRLASLTPADVRAVATTITKAGHSTSTAHRYHAVMVKMLKDAVIEGHAVPPRVLLVKPPAVAAHDRQAPAVGEAVALLKIAAAEPGGSRWVAALLQGMRQGECLGLTWQCVDLDRQVLDVSWQLQDLPFAHGCDPVCRYKRAGSCPDRRYRVPAGYEVRPLDGAWCLVRPKTAHGQRLIPIVPWMRQALIRHRDATAGQPNPHGLVWPGADGRPRLPDNDRADFRALQARAGIAHPAGRAYLVHEDRHATATLLMELGIPESVRVAILGHATVASTRVYEHADLSQARAALEAAAGRLGLG